MTFTHSRSSRSVMSRTSQGLALAAILCVPFDAMAQGYQECNQILAQDIFNKLAKSESSSSASTAHAIATFYQQSETEASDAYSKAHREAKKSGTKIDAEFHYGIIGGELGINLTSEKEIEASEFKDKFAKAKLRYQSSNESSSSSSQSLASSYASYMRDPATVNAWRECVTRTRETNLYAFASRDEAGRIFVNVMWVPGALGGTIPSIPINFVTGGAEEGIQVLADPEERVALGSGRHFAVSCGSKCDAGFQVTVNGAIKNAAGVSTSSFTTTVAVPPLKPPVAPACSLIFAANRMYEIGVRDSTTGQMVWGFTIITTMEQRGAPPGGRKRPEGELAYTVRLSAPGDPQSGEGVFGLQDRPLLLLPTAATSLPASASDRVSAP